MSDSKQLQSLIQKTVVLVKPDGVKRGLTGEIISRFEKSGLKLIAMKLVWVDAEMARQHYPDSRKELMEGIGNKTLETYEKYGLDPKDTLGTIEPLEIGRMVNNWNIDFMTSGPVAALLFEGLHAIENARTLAGNTMPVFAQAGTVRGDLSLDSAALANVKKRAVRNLVHASGNPVEAKYEAELWFKSSEIFDYKRADEEVMFG